MLQEIVKRAAAELKRLGLEQFQYQTHGAVMFFSGEKSGTADS